MMYSVSCYDVTDRYLTYTYIYIYIKLHNLLDLWTILFNTQLEILKGLVPRSMNLLVDFDKVMIYLNNVIR